MTSQSPARLPWGILLAASGILMITMAARQTTGLFVDPIHRDTGISIVDISFALAIGQFVWGAVQPLFGALADQRGPLPVLIGGGVLLAAGLALAPLLPGTWGLGSSLGLMMAAGAGAGSFSVLIGATAHRLPAERRSFAAGLINAGGSVGQFVFAPVLQVVISAAGWAWAMLLMAVVSLLTLPLAWPLRRRAGGACHRDRRRRTARTATAGPARAELLVPAPGVLYQWAAHRLPGHPPARRDRAVRVVVHRVLYVHRVDRVVQRGWQFAAALGFTWLATVPPTAGLVGKLFGPRYLGTLFGLTLLSHQIGGFLGAWLGGVVLANTGNYMVMWYLDIALALIAAIAHLPIREQAPQALAGPA